MNRTKAATKSQSAPVIAPQRHDELIEMGRRIERENRARMEAGTSAAQSSATESVPRLAGQHPMSGVLSPKQVVMAFEDIASTADIVGHLTNMILCDTCESDQDAEAVKAAAHKLTLHIGLLADLYGSRCGAPHAPVIGGVDEWLMRGVVSADSGDAESQGDAIR